jgi:hypothetical protein
MPTIIAERPAIALTINPIGFISFYICTIHACICGQSRFHLDNNGDLREQILHIEAHIEELTDAVERCRKIILISKAAGGILILYQSAEWPTL